MDNTSSPFETTTTTPSAKLTITRTGVHISPGKPTTSLSDGTMSLTATASPGTASKADTTNATETSTAIAPEETRRRLQFIKGILKSSEWEVVDEVRADNEMHCFLARADAAKNHRINWKICYTLRVPMKCGGNWTRFFFAGMSAAYANDTVSAPFRFGWGMHFDFTFSVPERTVADQPYDTQIRNREGIEPGTSIEDAVCALQSSLADAPVARARKETPKAEATNSLIGDYEVIRRPRSRGPMFDYDIWRANSRHDFFKRKYGDEVSSTMYAEFCKQPVSKDPLNQVSLLTEQIRAQEKEAEAEEETGEDADEVAVTRTGMRNNVTRALTTGSSAASRTPSLPRIDSAWNLKTTCIKRAEKDSELVYLPYGLMGSIRKLVASTCISTQEKVDVGVELDVMAVQTICCNCAGTMGAAEFHCSACGLHTVCKDCSVGIPSWFVTHMEKSGFVLETEEGKCEV